MKKRGIRLGRFTIIQGLSKSVQVVVRELRAIPPDFTTMEFRAGIEKPDGTFAPVTVTKDNPTGTFVITVPASSSALLTEVISEAETFKATFLPIIFKRDGAAQVQDLGYFDVSIKVWGMEW